MALGSADLTRIYKYQAFTLGDRAGGALTYNDVLALLNAQIAAVNDADTRFGTTFADEIQADLTALDSLDATLAREQASVNAALIKADVLAWEPGARTTGLERRFMELRRRVARVLSQSYSDSSSNAGVSMSYRG